MKSYGWTEQLGERWKNEYNHYFHFKKFGWLIQRDKPESSSSSKDEA